MPVREQLVRDRPLPARSAIVGGVTNACSVGGLALATAGHGIAAWALMTAGIVAMLAVHLNGQALVAGSPLRTSPRAAAVVLSLVALVVAGGLGARAVVEDLPWLAASIALTTGAASGCLLRWWQLRPVLGQIPRNPVRPRDPV